MRIKRKPGTIINSSQRAATMRAQRVFLRAPPPGVGLASAAVVTNSLLWYWLGCVGQASPTSYKRAVATSAPPSALLLSAASMKATMPNVSSMAIGEIPVSKKRTICFSSRW